MTSFEQAIARGKIEYMEKYKSAKLEDLDHIKKWLGYQVEFSPDRTKAVVHTDNGSITVSVKGDV